MRHRMSTSAASAALLLVSALGLAGCGGDSDSGSSPADQRAAKDAASAGASAPAGHNDADVVFASHMILHHQQALQLAGIAGWEAKSAEVKKVAAAITAVQEPQKKQMSAWLTSWGKPVPSPSHGGHHAEESIPGMLDEDEMHDVATTRGTLFDRVWIEAMIKHHQGAVTMAKTEQTSGASPEAIALAKKIVTDHSAQVMTLKRLLGRLPVG